MGLALDLLHLCAWAQLGTLTRVYLGKLFGAACGITGAGRAVLMQLHDARHPMRCSMLTIVCVAQWCLHGACSSICPADALVA